MKRIALISDQLAVLGGVRTSILSLCHVLKKVGYEIELGQSLDDVRTPDIVWAHSPSTLPLVQELLDWHNKNPNHPFIYQVHDYREICLTGRKSCGKDLEPCWREFGVECFAIHYSQGCGPAVNPLKLLERYKIIKEQLALMKMATRVVVFSDYVRDQVAMNGILPERIIKTLPYFTPPEAHEMRYRDLKQQNSLLWYGRFAQEKGPFQFINLLHQLKEANMIQDKDKAYMIGEGPLDRPLHLLAHELELDNILTFINWAQPQHLWNYISESTFVHFSSVWPEPFGLLGIETMALGIPVIGRPVGGAHEWLRNDFGHIAVNSDSGSHIFEAASLLLSDRVSFAARSQKLKTSFQEHFSGVKQMESINRVMDAI